MPRFPMAHRSLVWAAALLAAACASVPIGHPDSPVPLVRRGGNAAAGTYAERFPEAKSRLFDRLNRERRAAGATPVAYDLLGASVGDAFCLDAAMSRTSGHWDSAGRPPYLRWALAGGVDYHSENFSSLTRTGSEVEGSEVSRLLLDAHGQMMAERPPNDGHRRTVLDPEWTHVGIGAAVAGGEFRMVEEYSRRVVEWVDVPLSPVPARARAPFAVKLPPGWTLVALEVGFEPAPRPMSREEIRRRGSYAYPAASQRLLARAPTNNQYPDGSRGEVDLVRGVARADIPLLSGPGDYYVFVFATPGSVEGRPLSPLTAALIQGR
ncbi:MAG TPA: hypothetical protein VF425_09060 [Thermoanaerobaculia bacterium]